MSTHRPLEGPAEESWTIARVLTWAAGDLKARGSSSPRLDAELMLALVLGCDRIKLVLEATRPLSSHELGRYRELHKRRRLGEPIAYLRGEREFYGRPFRVDPRVLVPRPETEGLVDVALERTKHLSLCARVLDLCTGSGCVAITLQKERPTTSVIACDISKDALAVARDNALRLGARVGFIESDLFAAIAGRFDLITANPPYIDDAGMAALPRDVRDFEPRLALEAGPDALSITRRIIEEAPAHLTRGGILALETGAGLAGDVVSAMQRAGFTRVLTHRDHAGHERVVSGETP